VAADFGFTAEDAALFVNGTFRGSTELLASSNATPAELREKVTSPNGTTAAALDVLARHRIKGAFDHAVGAAVTRAKELTEPG
jgi:pyrroline-5-carboxylate reductase